MSRSLWEMGDLATHALEQGARALLAVPIATAERRLGLVLTIVRQPPLFPDDGLAVLGLLGEQVATIVANDELVREQRSLAAQLRDTDRELARVNEVQSRSLERIDEELRVARDIQLSLLPKVLPRIEGWSIAAHYQPARRVGGDFYDVLDLVDGRMAIVVGDVSDKGIPAALMMATTRSVLRAMSQEFVSPGALLQRANAVLCADMPAHMFGRASRMGSRSIWRGSSCPPSRQATR